MGHIRLGALHRTRRWQEVVGLIENGAAVEQVANAAIRAAEAGLGKVSKDRGVVETVHLFIHLPTAARFEDFAGFLNDFGVSVTAEPTLMHLTAAFTAAIDSRLQNNCDRTDLGEMAQMAAAETIAGFLAEQTHSFWDTTPEDVRRELAKLYTVKGFGSFARAFFGRLTHKTLDYFLSRNLYEHVGEGKRFVTLARVADFSQALQQHCYEAAAIVERFSGDYVSAHRSEAGVVTQEDARDFAHGAMKKMVAELKAGAGIHGN